MSISTKVNPNSSITRLKVYFMAKGYAHTYGINYSNTIFPMAKLTFVHFLFL